MHIAIIGAGMAGLAAARALRQRHTNITITIYEKSRGLGGRVATRRRAGFVFDHGAQNIKPSPAIERLLTRELPANGLRNVTLPVWTFDAAGALSPGDDAQNQEPKYVYADGLNRLGKLLAEGLDVRREVRVGQLTTDDRPFDDALRHAQEVPQGERPTTDSEAQHADSIVRRPWSIVSTEGAVIGTAKAVLLTPPAPQTAEIVAASVLDVEARGALLAELGTVQYNPCLSFALPYARRIERPFYALINDDRQHAITWLALEHVKAPERCPPNHSLLIAQMAPQWSRDHWDTPVEALLPDLTALVGALLGEDLLDPLWCDRQGWRYALPAARADFDKLNRIGSPHGLFFAGDYTADKGRVHLAIEHGWRVAELISRVAAAEA